MQQYFKDLLSVLGTSRISPSPYDTAWIARLGDYDENLSQQALDWLRDNQLEDGSWGTPYFVYNHERFISTLSAIVALSKHGRPEDKTRIDHGRESLSRWVKGLSSDIGGATIGFELIVPTLLDEARQMGVIESNYPDVLYEMAAKRTVKLAQIPQKVVNRTFTVAFSTEMMGNDAIVLLDIDNLQEGNGSIAYSPAATSYYLLNIRPGDQAALDYIRSIAPDGSAPYITPIEVFELGWGLWNLAHVGVLDAETLALCEPHLDFLEKYWIPQQGISACAGLTLVDGDTTGLVYEVLMRYGRKIDLAGVLSYEIDAYFQCFPLEANPSISTNIHVLGALHQAGYDLEHPTVQKVLNFLRQERISDTYWYDKWHASPYYATSHAIIACLPYSPRLVQNAVQWIVDTQNADGSWGYYLPTAEETAYCIQALAIWKQQEGDIPSGVISRGVRWLADNHQGPPYVPLWIGKSLYSPELVVQGAVICALSFAEQYA